MPRAVLPLFLLLALAATTATALPATCADPCVIQAAGAGYVPPVASIATGTSVVWASLDVSHPTAEALPSGNPCFIASAGPGGPAAPIVFTWDGATMRADGVACDSATSLPSGQGVLAYRCLLHGNMIGTLVVS